MDQPLTVSDDLAGERLDRVVAVLSGMSRSAARRLIDDGAVLVNGEPASARDRMRGGEQVEIPEVPEKLPLEPTPVDFAVVYEDDDVMVIDKPAGLVVHPGAGRESATLATGLIHRRPEIAGVGSPDRPGIVHRLDKDTSGLMAVAASPAGYEGLRRQVGDRSMERQYLALVDGTFEVPTGTIDAGIGRDDARPLRRKVDPAGRPARTHYEVEAEYPEAGMTLLRVRLETGRTHQIRVHLAAIDHPLAGDPVYRPGPNRVAVPRLFLHAARLGFRHPVTGEEMDFESPLPDDLAEALARLR